MNVELGRPFLSRPGITFEIENPEVLCCEFGEHDSASRCATRRRFLDGEPPLLTSQQLENSKCS